MKMAEKTRAPRARRITSALFAVTLAAGLLASRGARADGLADEAELHFQIAAEHYQKSEFREALEHFLLSNRLVPNKNVVFNIARTFEQLERFADAHRYYVDALAVETDPKIIGDINAAILRVSPNVAVIKVETTPPGATVYIDRKDLGSRGRSPRPLGVPEGKYRVLVELEGYEPAAVGPIEAQLGRETRVPITLKRIVGTVHVGVEGAPGAAVQVDDEKAQAACSAPCDLEIPPGLHQLYFTRDGFQAPPRQITVVARETVKTTATLSPLTGSVVVSADEREALVEVDGRPMGFTPAVLQNVAVGKRRVRVSLRGYTAIERDVEVKTGEQSQLIDLSLTPLREVAAASRFAESIEDAPSSVSIIDGQELRAFGYPTIAESLRGIRGFYLSNDHSYASAGIRGLGEPNDYGNRLLVLSDGQSLNDNLLNSSYIGSDGRVDLHDVDRIEVVRGPGSLLYGTGAFSGVVNLVPRAKDEPSSVHIEGGTYDDAVVHGRAGFHYNFAPRAGVMASVSGARSDGRDLAVTLEDPGGGPAVQTANNVDYFRSLGTAGRAWVGDLTAQWSYHTRTQYIPVGVAGSVFNDPRTSYRDTRMMAEVRYEPRISSTVALMIRAHANRYAFHSEFAGEPAPAPTSPEDYYGTWFGTEARVAITPLGDPRKLRIVVGGELQANPQADLNGSAADGVYLAVHAPYNFGAGYALVESSPSSWFRFSAGTRVDIYSNLGAIVVPRLALIFKPATGSTLKVMGGRAFRAPSIYERFYTDGLAGAATQVPGEDPKRGLTLGPETIYQGEIEFSQRFKEDWVALVAAQLSYVQGIINTIPDGQIPDVTRYANSPSPAISAGGEVELRREWRQGWMVSGTYGYQHAAYINRVDPTDANLRLINAPQHLGSIRGVIPVVSDLASLGVRTTYEAPRRVSLGSDELTRAALVADLTLSGNVKKFGVAYVIGMYNVFDAQFSYPVAETSASRTLLQNGRTFLADLKVTYP
jgi:outer membrane receptor for ferrienterochelin and colicins